jgi:hypothetical protein
MAIGICSRAGSRTGRSLSGILRAPPYHSELQPIEICLGGNEKSSAIYENLFTEEDQKLFESIAIGEFTISGFQNKHLRKKLSGKNSSQISRQPKRLHVHA